MVTAPEQLKRKLAFGKFGNDLFFGQLSGRADFNGIEGNTLIYRIAALENPNATNISMNRRSWANAGNSRLIATCASAGAFRTRPR